MVVVGCAVVVVVDTGAAVVDEVVGRVVVVVDVDVVVERSTTAPLGRTIVMGGELTVVSGIGIPPMDLI